MMYKSERFLQTRSLGLDAVLSLSKHTVFRYTPDLHFDGLSAALDRR